MSMIDAVLAELEHEAVGTRKALERVPEDKFGWKPHEKSMTLGMLASHLAEIPHWASATLEQEEFSMSPGEYKPWIAANRAELLAKFDECLAQCRKVMKGYPDDKLAVMWRFKMGGQVVFELPRAGVVRSMIMNHLVHHRGQLTVYLRLLDVPVPSLYGPSADEQG